MKEKLTEISFGVALGIVLFGILAMNFAKPPLKTLGGVIFLVALFFPLLQFVIRKLHQSSGVVLERSIFRLVRPMRTMAEPLFIYRELLVYKGIQEPALRRRTLYWRDGSIDSCFYASAIRGEPQRRKVIETCGSALREFLRHNFVPPRIQKEKEVGLSAFRQSPIAEPTVYASSMAINLLKLLEGIPLYSEPLGYDNAVGILGPQGNDIEHLLRFVMRCQDVKSGGFSDYPLGAFEQVISIQTTHSACFLLWNLERLHGLKERMVGFAMRCLVREQDGGEDRLGFGEHPGGRALSCSTYYSLRMIEKLEKREWIEDNQEELMSFLASCWHKKGGFKPFASSKHRTLIHTCLVVTSMLAILRDPSFLLEDERLQKLRVYIEACEDRYGGFQMWDRAFGLGGRWYAPNLYATYHVAQVKKLLKPIDPDWKLISLDETIEALLRATRLGPKGCIYRGYAIADSIVSETIAKLSRRLLDSLFMPSNSLEQRQ